MKIVFLKLERDRKRCAGACWDDDSHHPHSLKDLKLRPDDVVEIPGLRPPHTAQKYSLSELVQALINFNSADLHVAFEERGQISIGQHLYQETLGRLTRYDGRTDVDLRIISDDEHLAGLPWPLLAQQGLFLVNKRWTISSVTATASLPDVELPPSPKMLMVVPQPGDLPNTEGSDHRDAVRRLLEKFSPRMADADHFRVVATQQDYDKTRDSKYDVVYYYGHGAGTRNESRLLFESAQSPTAVPVPMRDFAEPLRAVRPKLIYLNCCSGDAGGLLGAGRQLAGVAPCVVTNRTIATVKAAKAQALAFWQHVLLNGVAPHVAVARNYQSLGELGLSSLLPHWFTPVIYANYREWSSHVPQQIKQYDAHWKLKLDRVDQFGRVVLKTQDLLHERRPRVLAFLWYGEEGQGMERFHERLEVELQPRLHSAEVVSRRTRWPDYASDRQQGFSVRAFEEMLLEALAVDRLQQIGGRLRAEAGNGQALVVLNHPHATSSRVMDPQRLLDYLHWWNDHVVRQLGDEDHFYLLGFSFRSKNVDKFRRGLSDCGYDALMLDNLRVDILRPLESIKRDDLLDFIQRHNIYIPPSHKDRHLDYILQRTKGRYEATLLELEKLVIEGYEEIVQRDAAQPAEQSGNLFAMDDE
jgi:hypothetical protein